MHGRLQRIAGAGLGGIVGTVFDVAVLVALVESGAPVALAAFLGAAAGAVVCFTVNKRWAFRDPSPLALRQVAAFTAVAAVTATLMAIAMHVATHELHLPYLVSKAMCAAVVFATWSYPAQRRLVFRGIARPRIVDGELVDDDIEYDEVELSFDPRRSLA
jgi:putative flippase GtrA